MISIINGIPFYLTKDLWTLDIKKQKQKNYLPFLIFTIIALGMHSLLLNKI